jgi:hypothetical protein
MGADLRCTLVTDPKRLDLPGAALEITFLEPGAEAYVFTFE